VCSIAFVCSVCLCSVCAWVWVCVGACVCVCGEVFVGSLCVLFVCLCSGHFKQLSNIPLANFIVTISSWSKHDLVSTLHPLHWLGSGDNAKSFFYMLLCFSNLLITAI